MFMVNRLYTITFDSGKIKKIRGKHRSTTNRHKIFKVVAGIYGYRPDSVVLELHSSISQHAMPSTYPRAATNMLLSRDDAYTIVAALLSALSTQ